MNKEEFLSILKLRFHRNLDRHPNIKWDDLYNHLINSDKIEPLIKMEETGGEPDLVKYEAGSYVFYDCSKETPLNRRSLCYDDLALTSRKSFKPADSAISLANKMGVKLLNEEEYKYLQTLGEFDLKTSSWLDTPNSIRELGGAIFADRRYDRVFIYHNGAESYYGVRGFRASYKI